jgi:hypothetical protein
MPSRRSFPPLECCLGVRPSQAAKCRPEPKRWSSDTAATTAVAITGPKPGTSTRRRHASSVLARSVLHCPVEVGDMCVGGADLVHQPAQELPHSDRESANTRPKTMLLAINALCVAAASLRLDGLRPHPRSNRHTGPRRISIVDFHRRIRLTIAVRYRPGRLDIGSLFPQHRPPGATSKHGQLDGGGAEWHNLAVV